MPVPAWFPEFAERWLAEAGFRPDLLVVAPRAEVACHEAAHALVSVALGVRIKGVFMGQGVDDMKGGLLTGYVLPDNAWVAAVAPTWPKRRRVRHNLAGIVICLAGATGQQRRYGRCTGHAADMSNAYAYSGKVSGALGPLELLARRFMHARRRADRLLTKHRDGWYRLTDVLTKVDRLDASEVERLLGLR